MKNREAIVSSHQLDNQASGPRSRRRRGFLTLASFAFPVWLALAASPACAAVGGSSTNANIGLPVGMWTILNAIPFVVPANETRHCMAVGSADVTRPNPNVLTTYRFTLVFDGPQPPTNLGQERTVQFDGFDDVRIKEVTTTYAQTLQAGAHIIYWLGAPTSPPAAPVATTVLDRSLTLVCDRDTLGIINLTPEPTPDLPPAQ